MIARVVKQSTLPERDRRDPCIDIMASKPNETLYTGVTSNLAQRVFQHRTACCQASRSDGCKRVVWYERLPTMAEAIAREKQIKGASRQKKCALIVGGWDDLYEGLA